MAELLIKKMTKDPKVELLVLVHIKEKREELEKEMGIGTEQLKAALKRVVDFYRPKLDELDALEKAHKENILTQKLPQEFATPGVGKYTVKWPWSYDVKKPDAVPRELCEPSRGKILQAVRQGEREIPGVAVVQKPVVEVRRDKPNEI